MTVCQFWTQFWTHLKSHTDSEVSMKTTVSVLLYCTQQKEIELAAKAAALKQKSQVEEQKRKLELRELMLLAELEVRVHGTAGD